MNSAIKQVRLYLFSTGRRRVLDPWVKRMLTIFGIGVTIFEIWIGAFGSLDPFFFGSVFLTSMLVVTFAFFTATPSSTSLSRPSSVDWLLILMSLFVGIYIVLNMDRYLTRIIGLHSISSFDLIIGIVFILLVIEGTRRTLGPGLTYITIIFMLYNLIGHLIPGYFSHRHLSIRFFVDQMVFTNDGLMGVPIKVAATYVFLFVFFGAVLAKSGGGEFFYRLASAITGKTSGGPAKIAVVSSGLFGMISGSPVSDVVTTGSITIPMMKKMGYPANVAGAVETVASSGGSIMPPIMGSAAFLMVEYAGIPYLTIISAAIIPAILYYLGCFVQVHLYSKKIGLRGFSSDEIPKLWSVLRLGYLYFTPLILLVLLLILGYTPSFCAVVVIFATIIISWTRRSMMMGPRAIYKIVETAIPRIAPLALACASAGLVIGGIMTTGLGGKFMSLIFLLSGGFLIPTLIVTMVVCIILGMGMPVPSAYVLTAVLAAPALIQLGVTPLAAHLFIVYFAVASAITPPVAVAAYAASAISEGDPIRIALRALRLGIGAFLVPFLFVLEPAYLLQGEWGGIAIAFLTGAIGIAMLGVAIEGYLNDFLNWFERLLFFFGGLISIYPSALSDLIGMLFLISALIMIQTNKRKKSQLA